LAPKKHLGQHFLISPPIAQKIVEAIPAGPDERVLEIGPGRGALTGYVLERYSDVYLIEKDKDVIAALKRTIGRAPCRILLEDALEFDFGRIGFPLHVVGNLPYVVGALIIKKTLLYGSGIRSFTFMVQREVAQRIVSPPHHKANGFLAIFCQYFGPAQILFEVEPEAFFPKPKIVSAVVQIIPDPALLSRLAPERWLPFFAFVTHGFSQRRKKLSNVLGRQVGEQSRFEAVLAEMGLNPLSRPEDLGVEAWLGLFEKWKT
jgi:16S rRNA (adenine1518-N6/adenine1519-N6)-dimethyltransferase